MGCSFFSKAKIDINPEFHNNIDLKFRVNDGHKKETRYFAGFHSLSAERIGFEPTNRFRRLHAFQACLFSHSSTFPWLNFFRVAKLSISCQINEFFFLFLFDFDKISALMKG